MMGTTETDDHLTTLRRQLAAARDPAARLPLLLKLGEALTLKSPTEAEALLVEAYEAALACKAENEVGRACWFLCELKREAGDIENAHYWAGRLAAAAQKMKSGFLEGYHHYALGATYWSAGDYEAARLSYERCLETWKKSGYRLGEISALNGLATIAGQQGRPAEQLELLQACVLIAEEIDAEQWRPWLAYLLAWPLLELGRWEEASQTFYRALALSEQRGTIRLMSEAFLGLGKIFLHRDMPDRARAMFRRAIEAGRKRETWPEMYRKALVENGLALLAQGDLAAAWHVLDEAETACRQVGAKAELVAVLTSQAEVALGRGLVRRSVELALEAETLAREVALPLEIGEALRVKALALAASSRPDEATVAFDEALFWLRDAQESYRLARVELHFGRFLAGRHEYAAAAVHLQAAVRVLRSLAMVANAVESIRLLMEIELARGSGAALFNALSSLSTLRLQPAVLVGHALSFICQATGADFGMVWAGNRAVARWERVGCSRSTASQATAYPVLFGGAQIGKICLEFGHQDAGVVGVAVAGVTSIIALPLHRLGALATPELPHRLHMSGVAGSAPAYQTLLAAVARLAHTDTPLLITGERATGRRFIARTVHDSSKRAGGPFDVVCCEGVPDDLLVDELFGHEADPGAGIDARPGRLSQAARGTLVLYELDAGPGLRSRLAEAVRTGVPDVRLIVILQDPARGGEPSDLCRGATLEVPPLRERREDIPALAQYFLEMMADEFNRNVAGLSSDAMARLKSYDWPGNVRELQQAIERAVMLAEGRIADISHLPPELRPG
ncbi:MAG: sigma 54-interacting transcriptional regulator [candidate division WOR-3 bacterium]